MFYQCFEIDHIVDILLKLAKIRRKNELFKFEGLFQPVMFLRFVPSKHWIFSIFMIMGSVSSVVAQMTQFFDTGCIFGVELASQKFRKFKKNLGFFFKNELLQIVTLVGKSWKFRVAQDGSRPIFFSRKIWTI